MSERQYSVLDELICKFDNGIKTLTVGANNANRTLPKTQNNMTLSDSQRKHIAGLMRINHTGEVCAQALYQGQALTAKNKAVRDAMQIAADEEIDHLVWCEQRLEELDSHTSYLGPVFYGLSFGIGALTGAISDKISLGFVEATEDQVCKHLQDHLAQVPESDEKTRAILSQMLIDEANHAEMAIAQGGKTFPKPVKSLMTLMSKVMTATTYRI
jgi:ubiquinone biosynthesis monooxygenase Coq7